MFIDRWSQDRDAHKHRTAREPSCDLTYCVGGMCRFIAAHSPPILPFNPKFLFSIENFHRGEGGEGFLDVATTTSDQATRISCPLDIHDDNLPP